MMGDRRYEQHALDALKKAVTTTLERKRRFGQYVVGWRDGQVVRFSPEQICSGEVCELGGSARPSVVRQPGPDDEDWH